MRTILVLALIGIVLGSQPQGIFSPPVEQQLKDTHLGRVFLRLITLKSKAQQFDFSQLFTALDDLETQIKQRIVDEGKQFQTDEVQYLTDVAFYQSQIAQYENEIATHEIDLQDSTEFRQELQKLLVTKSDELDQVKKSQSELVKSIAINQKIFEGQQSQYNNAIQAVDSAIELVGALRDGSFVSKKTNTVELLENSMKELTHRRVMYGPLIKGLAQILEPSFNDASAVSKVLKLLQTLRDNLSKSRLELENSYQAEREIDDHNLGDYNQRLSNLSEIIIPTIQAEIQTKDVDIQTKSNLLRDANSNLSAAKTNLETTNTRWVQRQLSIKFLDQMKVQSCRKNMLTNWPFSPKLAKNQNKQELEENDEFQQQQKQILQNINYVKISKNRHSTFEDVWKRQGIKHTKKSCRILQYFGKYLAEQLRELKYDDASQRCKALSSNMSMTRKVLRFGRTIGIILTIIKQLQTINKDKNDRSIILSKILMNFSCFLYFIVDHIHWLCKVQVIQNKNLESKSDYYSDFLWCFEALFDCIASILDIMYSKQKDEQERKRLLSVKIDLFRAFMDLLCAYGFTTGKIPQKWIGFMGTLSSLIGLKQQWDLAV